MTIEQTHQRATQETELFEAAMIHAAELMVILNRCEFDAVLQMESGLYKFRITVEPTTERSIVQNG